MSHGCQIIGLLHLADGIFIAGGCVSLCSGRFGDSHRIARFEEFERQFRVQDDWVEVIAGGNIAASIDEFILGVHGLAGSDCVWPNRIFSDHDVAGTTHRIIRFSGYDQRKGLKVRCDVQLAAMIVAQ